MFDLRKRLVDDFREYVRSFLKVRDDVIRTFFEEEMDRGALWPEPLLQLNPTFEQGPLVDDLVEKHMLDPRCGTAFRRGKSLEAPAGVPLRLFRHQDDAIQRAQAGRNYVLTTGTGSGKSLSYILPIVDAVLKEGAGKGIRAIVIYPMNALANSQMGELEKYLGPRSGRPAVSYALYTGQQNAEERAAILDSPPDILLTNFMMMELILTRVYEGALIKAMHGLRFVVLDELHTYRGRQGADVALLMRRLAERSGAPHIQFIGTSATMATEGTAAGRRKAVAEVGSRLFGSPVLPEDVIGETLTRFAPERDTTCDAFLSELRSALAEAPPTGMEALRSHPLTAWIESEVGLKTDDEGNLVRAQPEAIYGPEGVAAGLAVATGVDRSQAEEAIEAHLLAATRLGPDPRSGGRPFVFRLHQFFSPGIGIFASIASPEDRFLSLDGQKSAPGHPDRLLYPLCFCRICGQHYYIVTRVRDETGAERLDPRGFSDAPEDDEAEAGYLYLAAEGTAIDPESLAPDDWREEIRGESRIRRDRTKSLPATLSVGADGALGGPLDACFVAKPFSLCLNPECGASYGPRERSDVSKLSILGMQGRSTATTILSVSTLDYLRGSTELQPEARKLLSFTDNRQDASLQAGHLNDFVEVGLLRAAIYAAARDTGEDGVTFDEVALRVSKQLALDEVDYAKAPSTLRSQMEMAKKALRDVLGYRIYRDLQRGWRVNSPNLEQIGLLQIDYPDLETVCGEIERWQGCHQTLVAAPVEVRRSICHWLLELLRKKLAIQVDFLEPEFQEGMRRRSSQMLRDPWGLSSDEGDRLQTGAFAWLSKPSHSDHRSDVLLTARSAFGVHLRRQSTWNGDAPPSSDDVETVVGNIVRVLTEASIISLVHPTASQTAYQLNAAAFVWKAGVPGEEHRRYANRFFETFYRDRAANLKGITAREHTAQVSAAERKDREDRFRAGNLKVLFCSPTMELGIDIADLNVVNMRNVPPTPANYAQRSGRAGRSGQAALVFSYCTSGSPHDQYYFRRPEQMVAGAVAPPRLDVANEDLVRAHVHAVWLGEAGIDLGSSLAATVIAIDDTSGALPLSAQMADKLGDIAVRDRARGRARVLLSTIREELDRTSWHTQRWLDDVIDQIPSAFNSACERWRNLYQSALDQASRQSAIILNATSTPDQREQAKRLRREAEQQLELLRESNSQSLSDFYTYRYLASEGFLPGYNFPRLPLSAYLPGQTGRGDYLSRARFLAISEFGPGAVIYHEGSRYLANRVILPASSRQVAGGLVTTTAKLCAACAYMHIGDKAETADVCDRCGSALPTDSGSSMTNLFRLEAVSLRRKDRITSDEEERMRQGYDVRTGLRFQGADGEEQCVRADLFGASAEPMAKLTYSQAANIWRVNVGWNRRAAHQPLGYHLDLQKLTWISEKGANELMSSEDDALAPQTARVIPFVQDRRNALLFEWSARLSPEQHASLQAALRTAIQTVYQLDDGELAAEPLPSRLDRRTILFYESSEGGAGVLRRIVDEPAAMRQVARAALELCHYNPDTLEDLGRHPRAREACASACYDCIMSYGNQRDHLLLDRKLIVEFLKELRDGRVEVASGTESRSIKLERLMQRCGSKLEQSWLKHLDERKLNLPTHGQYAIPGCHTVADFAYTHGANNLAVFIDGPPHDYPQRQRRDAEQEDAMFLAGWLVQRFHHTEDWDARLGEHPGIYGGEA